MVLFCLDSVSWPVPVCGRASSEGKEGSYKPEVTQTTTEQRHFQNTILALPIKGSIVARPELKIYLHLFSGAQESSFTRTFLGSQNGPLTPRPCSAPEEGAQRGP